MHVRVPELHSTLLGYNKMVTAGVQDEPARMRAFNQGNKDHLKALRRRVDKKAPYNDFHFRKKNGRTKGQLGRAPAGGE